MKCPKCGKKFKDKMTNCPQCGALNTSYHQRQSKKGRKSDAHRQRMKGRRGER